MQIPLKIAFEGGLTSSDALTARIEREAAKLERFSDRITACRVVIRGRSGRHHQGELFDVRIHIVMPGHEDVVVDRNPPADHAHEDPYVAIRDAFNAARRRLQDHERRAAGQVKSKEPAPHGWIDRISREDGFGFIRTADGRELYFHRNALLHGDFDRLEPGAGVRFSEEEGEKGPQASTVHLLGKTRHIVDLV
jgi:cold shock CspA family protein/ribosome-associated translation inhibitor RaiA